MSLDRKLRVPLQQDEVRSNRPASSTPDPGRNSDIPVKPIYCNAQKVLSVERLAPAIPKGPTNPELATRDGVRWILNKLKRTASATQFTFPLQGFFLLFSTFEYSRLPPFLALENHGGMFIPVRKHVLTPCRWLNVMLATLHERHTVSMIFCFAMHFACLRLAEFLTVLVCTQVASH